MLIDSIAYLFETNMEKLVLGYYYRRKKIQKNTINYMVRSQELRRRS